MLPISSSEESKRREKCIAGPLEGIKILEVAEYLALPSAVCILSDWGAEVIKVEKPQGDGLRFLESVEGIAIKDINVWWEQTNRNKKGIAVDLWHAEGREIIYALAKKSDVFVSNFTPPVIERFKKAGEVIYDKVQTPLQVVNDPQALANDFFTEVEHPSGRKIKLIASPAKFSRTPGSIRTTAPEIGQHTEEVLLEMGYSRKDLGDLKDKRVIFSPFS